MGEAWRSSKVGFEEKQTRRARYATRSPIRENVTGDFRVRSIHKN
jgi:hypothetical protein